MTQSQAELGGVLAELSALKGVHQVLVLDERGQVLALTKRAGDAVALASLVASSWAAAKALAGVLRTDPFVSSHYENTSTQLVIAAVGMSASLVVLFDHTLAAGLVRYKIRLLRSALQTSVETLLAERQQQISPLGDVTDAELDGLFA